MQIKQRRHQSRRVNGNPGISIPEGRQWDNKKASTTIIDALNQVIKRGMKPNLSLLGGDPIVPENIDDTLDIIKQVKPLSQTQQSVFGRVSISKIGGEKMALKNKFRF